VNSRLSHVRHSTLNLSLPSPLICDCIELSLFHSYVLCFRRPLNSGFVSGRSIFSLILWFCKLNKLYPDGSSSLSFHSPICVFTLSITCLSSLYCLNLDHYLSSHYNMCLHPNHHFLTHSALWLYQDRLTSTYIFSVSIRIILCVCIRIINYSPTLFCFQEMF